MTSIIDHLLMLHGKETKAALGKPCYNSLYTSSMSDWGSGTCNLKTVQQLQSFPGAYTITSLVLISLFTFAYTSIRSQLALLSKSTKKSPPTLPSYVPLLGHAISFVWSIKQLSTTLTTYFPQYVPVHFRLFKLDMYLITGPENIMNVFKNERSGLPAGVGLIISIQNMFNVSQSIIDVYKADNSGVMAQPAPWSNVEPSRRIYRYTHARSTEMFMGPSLQKFAGRFMTRISSLIRDVDVGEEWLDLPDLYAFVKRLTFRAAVESLCGSYIFTLNPSFEDDFWAYDERAVYLLKGFPRWLAPQAWKSRDACLKAVRKWQDFANEQCSLSSIDPDIEFEPYFGAKYNRDRMNFFSSLNVSLDELATTNLGLIWATNSNTIPATMWCLLEIIQSPGLLDRVREQLAPITLQISSRNIPKFNEEKLYSNPLLQSIFAETLRLRVAILHMRNIERSDFQMNEWALRENNLVVISSHTAHMNPEVWSTGNGEDVHPLDEFYADRFLVYANNENSGPLKKQADKTSTRGLEDPFSPKNLSGEPSEVHFSLKGLNGSWIPFGGGQHICPGRNFAKQEILLALATFLHVFDFELNVPAGWRATPDLKQFGTGTLPPIGQIPCRIRRRL